ncbi:hypothetical protein Taro_056967 [Colocasia esculenta]|uniref:Uncharacterized protein n=1 Tax=Colocasia esculenta TaxID=4460 RepID=A0A843XX74_COLES|nr:hypothetical protein [Colocasia esculenta]
MTFTFVPLVGLFVPPLGDYKHFEYMSVDDGGVCATIGQRCLDARHLTTAEDLNTDAESHVTTCVVFPRRFLYRRPSLLGGGADRRPSWLAEGGRRSGGLTGTC